MARVWACEFSIRSNLYRCLDSLLEHREELFRYLRGGLPDEFAAKSDMLLYDLTSTYFESDPPFLKETNAALARAGINARTVCRWSLQAKLRQVAGGLTPPSLLEKFGTMQMMDVFFPAEEAGKELLLALSGPRDCPVEHHRCSITRDGDPAWIGRE